jgi:hypothetical protein
MIERGGELELGNREMKVGSVVCLPIESNLCPLDSPAIAVKFDNVQA